MSHAPLSRREFLSGSTLVLLAPGAIAADLIGAKATTFGLVTDVHFARTPNRGSRHFEESIYKLREAVSIWKRERIHAAIELGDFIDTGPGLAAQSELEFLQTINAIFKTSAKKRGYVIGNHCLDSLTKPAFLKAVGQPRGHVSFDVEGWHLVLLDACYTQEGGSYEPGRFSSDDTTIPDDQIDWLQRDLSRTKKPTLVFCHQRLDWTGETRPPTGVASAPKVRAVLEASGKVRAVFMGHTHANDYAEVGGIPYVTLRAMVEGSGGENSGYATLSAYEDGSLVLRGHRLQASREIARAESFIAGRA